MLRPFLVVALIALALPAQAAQPALTGIPTVANPIADRELSVSDPLASADPAVVAPLVLALGYADAARALDQQAQAASGSNATTPADDGPLTYHSFDPLGDVNGNGRDDVVLMTWTEEEDNITYTAIDGGRQAEVLWTFTTGEEQYAYVAGDIDEDGVFDVMRMDDDDQTSTQDDNGNFEARSVVTILSGRDLTELATLVMTTSMTYEQTQPSPLPVGTYTETETFSFEYVYDLFEQPGMARITLRFHFDSEDERVLGITTSSSQTSTTSRAYALLGVDGSVVWQFEEEGWDVSYDEGDGTGDGVPDLVVMPQDQFDFEASGNIVPFVDPPVAPPVPIPGFGSEPAERIPFQLRLLDGTNGQQSWSRTFGNFSFSYTQWFGDLYGNGPVLYAYYLDIDPATFDYSIHQLLLDGKTGETLKELTGERALNDLGDANGDGRDDLLAVAYEGDDEDDGTYKLEAVDGDFNSLWTLDVAEEDFAGWFDMTGDGVGDIVLMDYDERSFNYTVISGTNGQELWTRSQARVADYSFAPGIADEEDLELGFLLTDAVDDADLGSYPMDILLLRGSDGAPLWQKPVFDPKDYEKVAADDASFYLGYAGDLNGDGADDFILNLYQGFSIHRSTTCDDDGCETTTEDSRDDDDGQPLAVVSLVDGATGATYLRFDDMRLAPKIEVVKEEAVDVKPAAEDLVEENGAPGLELVGILAAIGVALLVGRRLK